MLSLNVDPIALAVLGFAGVVVGLVEVGLSFVRRFPTWGISLGVVAILALAGGAAYACGEGPTFGQPALILAAVTLTLLLFRSRHSIAGRPLVQGLLLMVLGGALVGYATYRIDKGLENELVQSDYDLAQFADPLEEHSSPALEVSTDAGAPIPLYNASLSTVSVTEDVESRYLRGMRLDKKLIQTAPADLKYNCHGWVFTGGQYWLRSNAIETILKDNAYRAVKNPRAGDVAVFRNNLGEVTHTGLVRAGSKEGALLIESKWGRFGRYVHTADDHGYRGQEVTYYRTSRGSHLLKGLQPAATASAGESSGS